MIVSRRSVRMWGAALCMAALVAAIPANAGILKKLKGGGSESKPEAAPAEPAQQAEYRVEDGRTNPFLHLSMHLAIAEQLSIDQPHGIRAAYEQLVRHRGDAHAAAHDVMECLGEIVWTAQRAGAALPPEEMSARYLECLARRAGRN